MAVETCGEDSSPAKALVFQKTIYRPPRLSHLASRFKRRYSVHPRHAHDYDEYFPCSDDKPEDEPSTEPEESCQYDTAGPNRAVIAFNAHPPRVVLLELPTEILEHIAASLRDPIPVLEAASRYIDERYSDFSQARFALSAFSKVCSTLRGTVERILYRDVQLDFTGWKGRKHTKWPAASLALLLRTLESRPELGLFIYTAALDYPLSSKSEALEKGLRRFLELSPNLKSLFLGQCPLVLWDVPMLKTVTFATTFASGILPSILSHFPSLQNLYLRDCHIMSFSLNLPYHRLKTIRLDSNHEHAAAHISRALILCSGSVLHLDIRFMGGLLHPAPNFTPRVRDIGIAPSISLHSLRLDNISVFSHLDSAYIQVLQSLPALKRLHVSNHSCFSPNAFTELPSTLIKVTASDYYGCWERRPMDAESEGKSSAFMAALAVSISMSTRKITHVVASPEGGAHHYLEHIREACELEKIKYTEVEGIEAFVEVNFLKL